MSLTLATPVSNERASHPELRAKGLTGYTTCAMSSLRPSGFPLRKQVAYDEYAKNIAMFIAATTRNEKLIATAQGATLNPAYPAIPFSQ